LLLTHPSARHHCGTPAPAHLQHVVGEWLGRQSASSAPHTARGTHRSAVRRRNRRERLDGEARLEARDEVARVESYAW
jgi:hypothetical protein